MKTIKILRYTLSFLGLCAGVWLASEAMAYQQYSQQIAAREQDAALSAKLTEVVQLNNLLHQINSGRLDAVKVDLGSRLADALDDIQTLMPAAQPTMQDLACMLTAQTVKFERLHPECYASLNHQAAAKPGEVIQVAQH